MLSLTFNIQPVKSEPTTIIVPDDYPTIQEAVNAAGEGNTIFVRNGTYYENVVVNKTVSLIGENRTTTIIGGNGKGNVVEIISDNVKITGFTILQFVRSSVGILLNNANNCNITRNILIHNKDAIILEWSSNNSITLNYITETQSDTLFLRESSHNIIAQNKLENNHYGIDLIASPHNIVSENEMSGNFMGVSLGQGDGFVHSSDYNLISGNKIWDCNLGVFLLAVSENHVVGNFITGCFESGGIVLNMASVNNTISRNNVANNSMGVYTFGPSTNRLHHNNFINNTVQVHHQYFPALLLWDDGYPSGGNYWSDYPGIDFYKGLYQNETGSDGIGDTPYATDENNQDNYPWMNPWGYSGLIVNSTPITGIPFIFEAHTGSTAETDSTPRRVTVVFTPFGGYSFPIKEYTVEKPSTLYLALMAILTVSFTMIKRKTHKRTKQP